MIDGIFHIINFVALYLLLHYLFRKYFYERIAQTMIMSQASYTNLIKRNEQLRKQEQGLIRAYYHQNYRYEELSRKTEVWNHKVDQDYQLRMKQSEEISNLLDKRDIIQQKNLRALTLCEHVMQQVVTQAEQELTEQLTPHKKEEYTRRLIHSITQGHHVRQH